MTETGSEHCLGCGDSSVIASLRAPTGGYFRVVVSYHCGKIEKFDKRNFGRSGVGTWPNW